MMEVELSVRLVDISLVFRQMNFSVAVYYLRSGLMFVYDGLTIGLNVGLKPVGLTINLHVGHLSLTHCILKLVSLLDSMLDSNWSHCIILMMVSLLVWLNIMLLSFLDSYWSHYWTHVGLSH